MANYDDIIKRAFEAAQEALKAGDIEKANEYYRVMRIAEEQPDVGGEMSAAEKFVVGAGRTGAKAGQAVKQTGMMMDDLRTGGDTAQKYTERLNEDDERWNRDFPDVGMQTLGQAAPLAALTAVTGGATGVARGALAGGLESTLLSPTQQAAWLEKAKAFGSGVGIGGGLGAVGGAKVNPKRVPDTQRSAIMEDPSRTFTPNTLNPDSALMEKMNRFSLLSKSRAGRVADNAERDVNKAIAKYSDGGGEYAFQKMQNRAKNYIDSEEQLYNGVYSAIGDVPVPVAPMQQEIVTRLNRLASEGGRNVKDLDRASKILFENMPEGQLTIEKARKWRENIRKTNMEWLGTADGAISKDAMFAFKLVDD